MRSALEYHQCVFDLLAKRPLRRRRRDRFDDDWNHDSGAVCRRTHRQKDDDADRDEYRERREDPNDAEKRGADAGDDSLGRLPGDEVQVIRVPLFGVAVSRVDGLQCSRRNRKRSRVVGDDGDHFAVLRSASVARDLPFVAEQLERSEQRQFDVVDLGHALAHAQQDDQVKRRVDPRSSRVGGENERLNREPLQALCGARVTGKKRRECGRDEAGQKTRQARETPESHFAKR